MRKAEWTVAVLLVSAVVWLNLEAASHAGALWRDEANTVGLATLPRIGDVWRNLQFDSFPLLWVLILREFCAMFGPLNDTAFRVLGFAIGTSVLGVSWYNARTFQHSFPLLSVCLFAMTPSLIVWGDTVRAYGFGILLILLCCALMWRFIEKPSSGSFLAAALAAIASVQTVFYNSVLLLAICSGALAVCGVNKAWKKAALIVIIGCLAAISMAPYATTISQASSWNRLVRIPDYTLLWFWGKLDEALRPGGYWAVVGWLESFLLAVVVGVAAVIYPARIGLTARARDVALFSLVTLVVGVAAIFLFLHKLSYLTQPWYYISLLALAAVCIDALFGSLIRSPSARFVRLSCVLLLVIVTFVPAVRSVQTRLTNVDIVASVLKETARPNDLVLVSDWAIGVSFARYYRAAAPWMTVPPIPVHRVHRYDLIRDQMTLPNQTAPMQLVTAKAGDALRNGHRVFVVGPVKLLSLGERPRILPPLDTSRVTWPGGAYTEQWSSSLGYFLNQHAEKMEVVRIFANGAVNQYENPPFLVAEGWRP